MFWAHSANSNGDRHCLETHLEAVAEHASVLSGKWDAAPIGRALGYSHDLAKSADDFQTYLLAAEAGEKAIKCPHSDPSAVAVADVLGPFAMVVQGHHGGIPSQAAGKHRRDIVDPRVLHAAKEFRGRFDFTTIHKHPAMETRRDAEHLLRMSLSALVDADFLDTEAHFSGKRPDAKYPELPWYLEALEARLAEFPTTDGAVAEVRREVQLACRDSASLPQGFFRLTVPTGGGKTLSSLLFALRHAVTHDLDRIIVAIPFTGIVEQTADVYGNIFGPQNVLEHHSAVPVLEDEDFSPTLVRHRLAAENWDCPLVVTTNVQIFESLLSNRPSKCRKLHSIARSVVVLDEIQSLPPDLIEATTDVLSWMTRFAKTTVVFCTATQPNYREITGVPEQVKDATEIVANHGQHFSRLKRVEFLDQGTLTKNQVAEKINGEHQALAILNTKKDSAEIHNLITGGDAFYLSTWICGAHRRRVLEQVKDCLASNLPCRLISTQVVEAGVDVDFPVVMRALAPLDSLVQAAGRCNRNGNLETLGRFEVFELEGGRSPKGSYRSAIDTTRRFIPARMAEVGSAGLQAEYTRAYFANTGTDRVVPTETGRVNLQKLRESFDFPNVAKGSHLIEEETTPVVTLNYAPELIEALLEEAIYGNNPRLAARKLSPYTVSLRPFELDRAVKEKHVQLHSSGFHVWTGPYDHQIGIGKGSIFDPDEIIC